MLTNVNMEVTQQRMENLYMVCMFQVSNNQAKSDNGGTNLKEILLMEWVQEKNITKLQKI